MFVIIAFKKVTANHKSSERSQNQFKNRVPRISLKRKTGEKTGEKEN